MSAKKSKTVYVCDSCGNEYLQWQGKCDACQEWNTLKPITIGPAEMGGGPASLGDYQPPRPISDAAVAAIKRTQTSIPELDRVLGGGLVPGSLVLLSGDPGVGKSTLLLQTAATLCDAGQTVVYVSGEESESQVRSRADRIGGVRTSLLITPVTSVQALLLIAQQVKPQVMIVDSIQTMRHDEYPSSPGSMVQLRECAQVLQHIAKRYNITIIMIGHVTKQGTIAGPKMLEHMVDTVLAFDDRNDRSYRLLRVEKNRFGDTAEVGVFEMTPTGFVSIADPSHYFLAERNIAPGSVLTVVLEGQRPLVLEVQALANKTTFGYPKRAASGFDVNRLQLLLAILERHAGVSVSEFDVYVNVVGGLKVREPAADLAVCAAVVSSLRNQAVNERLCLFGEVGLTGEVRKVLAFDRRNEGVQRLGYQTIPYQTSLKKVLEGLFTTAR